MLTLHLSVIFLLIIVNGFFAMAEIALVASRKARLQPLAEVGNPGAEAALELKADPSRLLATVQIGVTVIAILSGTFGEATLGDTLQQEIESYQGLFARYAHIVSMAVVVIGISYFSLILGELVPKRIALVHPERIAAALARIMRVIARVGAPIEWLLSASTNLVLRLLPLRGQRTAPVTDEEISFMLREGVATGHIPEAETAIVEMALRLGERRASAVMTPRTRIESLDLDDPEEENRRKIRDSAYSRFPVVQDGSQQVIGIVHAKDLLIAALAGRPFDLRASTRPPLYLPNTVTVLRVLEVRREDGTCLIDGMVGLDELRQVLGVSHLPGEDADFHTLGGYVMARLNRVPMVADRVTAAGYRFEVVRMDGRRVDRVLVSPVSAKGR